MADLTFGSVAGQTFTGGTVSGQAYSLPAAGGWTPADATGLVAWWDLTSTDYLTVSGADVTAATDRSGNGHHLDVASATEPTFNATRFGASVGGVDFVAASSTSLSRNAAPVTAAPFQVYVVARATNVTGANTAFCLLDKDSDTHYWNLGMRGDVASDPVRWFARAGGAEAIASTSTSYSANTTYLLWALEASATSRAVRLDGAGEGTETTSTTPAGADRLAIGGLMRATPTNFLNGSIAEVVLLNTDSVADRASFHAYFNDRYGLSLP